MGKLATRRAGVAQWQCGSLPSYLHGFDSRHPLSRVPVPSGVLRGAGVAQSVERNLAKVEVAGSKPVSRSTFSTQISALRAYLTATLLRNGPRRGQPPGSRPQARLESPAHQERPATRGPGNLARTAKVPSPVRRMRFPEGQPSVRARRPDAQPHPILQAHSVQLEGHVRRREARLDTRRVPVDFGRRVDARRGRGLMIPGGRPSDQHPEPERWRGVYWYMAQARLRRLMAESPPRQCRYCGITWTPEVDNSRCFEGTPWPSTRTHRWNLSSPVSRSTPA